MEETIWTTQLVISLALSAIIAAWFIGWQLNVYLKNKQAIDKLARFFSKKEYYSTYESYDNDTNGNITSKSVKIKEVADDDAELKT